MVRWAYESRWADELSLSLVFANPTLPGSDRLWFTILFFSILFRPAASHSLTHNSSNGSKQLGNVWRWSSNISRHLSNLSYNACSSFLTMFVLPYHVCPFLSFPSTEWQYFSFLVSRQLAFGLFWWQRRWWCRFLQTWQVLILAIVANFSP